MNASPQFKLDIGCVERDEEKCEFLSACSNLDLRTIRHLVDVRAIDVQGSLDCIGQNCLHFVVCSAKQDLPTQEQLIGYLVSVGANGKCAGVIQWKNFFKNRDFESGDPPDPM